MNPFALVSVIAFVIVVMAVSARLLLLARRTRRPPELLLGLSLLLPFAAYGVAIASAIRTGGRPTRVVLEVGGIVADVGFLAMAAFVWLVFRRKELWGLAFALVLLVATACMPIVNHVLPPVFGVVPAAVVPRAVLRTVCYAWGAVEALHYFGMMKRRLRLGLAEPLLTDRFRVWSLALVSSVAMYNLLVVGGIFRLLGSDWAPPFNTAGAFVGIPAALLLYLSFFPPESYRRAVERRLGEGAAA